MNFEQYLFEIGESACEAKRRSELYRMWRAAQLQRNQRRRRQDLKRIELKFSHAQYDRFKKDALELKISPTTLLQLVIENGYEEQIMIVQSYAVIEKIHAALNCIATGISQISFQINSRKTNAVYKQDIAQIQQKQLSMENAFLSYCTPVNLETYFREQQSKNPRFVKHAQMIINALMKEIHAD